MFQLNSLSRDERQQVREIRRAYRLIAKDIGTQVLDCVLANPGYVPTIRERRHAIALAGLGVKSWDPATGSNW